MALDGVKLVTLDALGTLVELEDPFGRLQAELAARGAPVEREVARRALLGEMAHYREHHDIASDEDGLARLRDDCAEVLRGGLPAPARELPHAELLAALLAALRFRPFPEVPGVLAALRDAGCALVVVSNWDVSLHGVLETTGLRPLLDGVITSAEVGASKPDPSIFAPALALAGVEPAQALHVGDSVEYDVEGALRAGLSAVLIDRDGTSAAAPPGVGVVATLDGVLTRPSYPEAER
jgi:putative hydrolase of the HAD superfamily